MYNNIGKNLSFYVQISTKLSLSLSLSLESKIFSIRWFLSSKSWFRNKLLVEDNDDVEFVDDDDDDDDEDE